MEMLTLSELADRYPVTYADSRRAWERMLERWRSSNRLRRGLDWQCRSVDRGRPPVEYVEVKVLTLVCSSDLRFAEVVRTEHKLKIREALKGGEGV